jgi:hypothetical protein
VSSHRFAPALVRSPKLDSERILWGQEAAESRKADREVDGACKIPLQRTKPFEGPSLGFLGDQRQATVVLFCRARKHNPWVITPCFFCLERAPDTSPALSPWRSISIGSSTRGRVRTQSSHQPHAPKATKSACNTKAQRNMRSAIPTLRHTRLLVTTGCVDCRGRQVTSLMIHPSREPCWTAARAWMTHSVF